MAAALARPIGPLGRNAVMDDHGEAHAAAEALSALAAASSDREAWRQWRALERRWDALSPALRAELKRAADRLRATGSDARGHLVVVARLPD